MRAGAAKVIFAMVGIFLAGAIVGGVSSIAWMRHHSKKADARQVAERQMRRLVSRLDLTPEQLEHIRPVIREFEEKIREARRRAYAGIREIVREMNERIEAELTPEQRAVFAGMCEREREHFERFMEKRREHKNGASGGQATDRQPLGADPLTPPGAESAPPPPPSGN